MLEAIADQGNGQVWVDADKERADRRVLAHSQGIIESIRGDLPAVVIGYVLQPPYSS